jgi:lipid A ethanolaminephosphotransferase
MLVRHLPFPSSFPQLRIHISHLILLCALGFTLLYNLAFFHNSYAVYGNSPGGLLFMGSLAVFLFAVTLLLLSLLCFRFTTKPLLIAVIVGAAAASSYMNSYNVVIDTTMLTNIIKTDRHEVADLMSLQLLLQILVFGVLPGFLVYKTQIRCAGVGKEVLKRLQLIGLAVVLMVLSIAPFTSWYTGFFREQKILRYYSNPATFLYSGFSFISSALADSAPFVREAIGVDAHLPAADTSRELIILVVGEAARADRFTLNGYARQTNPLLAQEDVISFSQATSCATSTAYSLPCMFSLSDRKDFSLDEANHTENLLDVLTHSGANVLWRDNNSDSKGVTVAIPFEDWRAPDTNPVCDIECRDVGMLAGLPEYIANHDSGDIVIVMHQLGNHGPAYYKRYPAEFEKFTPVCATAQLETCTDLAIGNTYDNAILYTDYFLTQVIHFLQTYDDRFETAMYYMSDHGESLGENGLYLHGLPYTLAPDSQKHVASVMWFGSSYRIDRQALRARAEEPVSHDSYFHTVLGLMEVETSVYDPAMDLVTHASTTR